MTLLNVGIAQITPSRLAVKENLEKIYSFIMPIAADLIVLPELCTTGYVLTDEEACALAETRQGKTIQFFQEMSDRKNSVVVAGFLEKEGEKLFNSCVFCLPKQEPIFYRKSHLFYKESAVFTPGDGEFPLIEVKNLNLRIGGMICYDWRFPEVTRMLALKGADIIVCPANLVTDVWKKVFPGRAVENGVYMLMVNRCGDEGELHFTGKSALYDPNGELLVEVDSKNDTAITIKIDLAVARNKKINKYNDIFGDRRPEIYTFNNLKLSS